MARQNLDDFETYPAAVSFTASRGCATSINTSGQAALCGAGLRPDGIIDDAVASGAQARVMKKVGARQPMLAGSGGVTVGALLAVGASGTIVIAASTNVIIGKAITAAAAGALFEGLYYQYGGIAP